LLEYQNNDFTLWVINKIKKEVVLRISKWIEDWRNETLDKGGGVKRKWGRKFGGGREHLDILKLDYILVSKYQLASFFLPLHLYS
jgi:hypothetical protein